MAPGEGLDKNILITGIKNANEAVKGMTDENAAWELWVSKLADTIETFVRSGKVITAGTAASQTGTIT